MKKMARLLARAAARLLNAFQARGGRSGWFRFRLLELAGGLLLQPATSQKQNPAFVKRRGGVSSLTAASAAVFLSEFFTYRIAIGRYLLIST
jgi:hypothetical protein